MLINGSAINSCSINDSGQVLAPHPGILQGRCEVGYEDALQGRFEVGYQDKLQGRCHLSYEDSLQGRCAWSYGAVTIQGRYNLVYDLSAGAKLSGRADLVYSNFPTLLGRAEFLYDLKASNSGRFGLVYDLDTTDNFLGRVELPYSLLAEQVAQVQSGLFILRTTHG